MTKPLLALFITCALQAATYDTSQDILLQAYSSVRQDAAKKRLQRQNKIFPQTLLDSQEIVEKHFKSTAYYLLQFQALSSDVKNYVHKLAQALHKPHPRHAPFFQRWISVKDSLEKALCAVLYEQILSSAFDTSVVSKTMEFASIDQLNAVYIAVYAAEKGAITSIKGTLLKDKIAGYPLSHTQADLWKQAQKNVSDGVKNNTLDAKNLHWPSVWQIQGFWLRDWCRGAAALAKPVGAILPLPPAPDIEGFFQHLRYVPYTTHHLQRSCVQPLAALWAQACIDKRQRNTVISKLCPDLSPEKNVFQTAVDYCTNHIDPSLQALSTPQSSHDTSAELRMYALQTFMKLLELFHPNQKQVIAFCTSDAVTTILIKSPEESALASLAGHPVSPPSLFSCSLKAFASAHPRSAPPSLYSYSRHHFAARHHFLEAVYIKLNDLFIAVTATHKSQACQAAMDACLPQRHAYVATAKKLLTEKSCSADQYSYAFGLQKTLEELHSSQMCTLLSHALQTESPHVAEVFHLCSREDAYNVLLSMPQSPHAQRLSALINATYPSWLTNLPSFNPSAWLLQQLTPAHYKKR